MLNKVVFMKNHFRIKRVTPHDVSQDYLDTLNAGEQSRFLGEATKQQIHTYESLRDYVKDKQNRDDDFLFGIFENDNLLGTSRVHDFNASCAWQGVLVFQKYQNKGVGQALVTSVSDFMLETKRVLTIYAGILEDNIPSQKTFSKSGFSFLQNDLSYTSRQIWKKCLDRL